MGHIPIVNQDTIQKVITEGCISTRGNLKDYKVKTIADLFADALTTRVGDLVFPWIIGSKNKPNIGFKYVFKVADKPYFVHGLDSCLFLTTFYLLCSIIIYHPITQVLQLQITV